MSPDSPADYQSSALQVVDDAVAEVIATEAGGRVLDIAEAKIIEADVEGHQARVDVERQRRYVALGRSDEFGLRTLIARIDAGDAAWIQATVSRVAEILTPTRPGKNADEIRAIALGYLARPADLLDALRATDLTKLRPKTVLYVHLHESTLHGITGVARVDYDHPTPYRWGQPLDSEPQTGTHNSGPLGRQHHRWKTHANYQTRQSGPGRYAWLTPNGLGFLVDHQGAHPITPEHARMIINAPPSLEIYPPINFEVDLKLADLPEVGAPGKLAAPRLDQPASR